MKINDVMVCTGFVILFLLASVLIPIIGLLFSVLIPLPFLFYSSKLGLHQGLIISLITLLLVGFLAVLAGYPYILIQCIELCLLGLIISEIFRREISLDLTVFWGIFIMLLIAVVFLIFIGISVGKGPIALVLDYFQSDLDQALQFYENIGLTQEQVTQLKKSSIMFLDLFKKIFPSVFIVWTGFVVWINIVICKTLFRLKGIKYPEFKPMDRWQAPEFMVWGLIASGFALFLPISGIKWVAVNILIVMSVIYLFNGLSIVLFIFNKYKIPAWARFTIYVIMTLQFLFWFILALAGLFDQWIDFRKIHYKESEVT